MLLKLSIKNFKSIREAHVRFGPCTCFTGHNGVGKSNLFDAIHFLGALTERPISDAATEVRRTSDGGYSPLDLVFGRDSNRRIELCADMVAPPQVEDDFGQVAKPSTTLLTYQIRLKYQPESDRLLVEHESLTHAKLEEYGRFVGFVSSKEFKKSVALGTRRGGPLISTKEDRIQLHGDGGSRGRPSPVGKSPLTVVGGTNTYDYPTVLAAKREMASWRILHLEPSAMRTPDSRSALPHVSASGGHIPATLHALVARDPAAESEILFRLRQLNSDIAELETYSDDVRDQLALRARVPGVANWLYGRSLSDGTLRYVALVLMLADVQDRAVLCIEEPENGIHPSRGAEPGRAATGLCGRRQRCGGRRQSPSAGCPQHAFARSRAATLLRRDRVRRAGAHEEARADQHVPAGRGCVAYEHAERAGVGRAADRPTGSLRLHRRLTGEPGSRPVGSGVWISQVSRQLTWSIVADGGTDQMLVPAIEWAIHRLDSDVEILEPEFRKRHGSVREFLHAYESGAMLIFVHRDSENLALADRLVEFDGITRSDVVPVVPVQMSEAWILFNGSAVARAAGSPGTEVHVPGIGEIENIRNPKERLDELLLLAAGSPTGRRGKIFRRSIAQRRVSVADYIADYSPLENVPAFQRFQDALAERYPYRHLIE